MLPWIPSVRSIPNPTSWTDKLTVPHNYSEPHSQNRIFDASLLLMRLLRQINTSRCLTNTSIRRAVGRIYLPLNSCSYFVYKFFKESSIPQHVLDISVSYTITIETNKTTKQHTTVSCLKNFFIINAKDQNPWHPPFLGVKLQLSR